MLIKKPSKIRASETKEKVNNNLENNYQDIESS